MVSFSYLAYLESNDVASYFLIYHIYSCSILFVRKLMSCGYVQHYPSYSYVVLPSSYFLEFYADEIILVGLISLHCLRARATGRIVPVCRDKNTKSSPLFYYRFSQWNESNKNNRCSVVPSWLFLSLKWENNFAFCPSLCSSVHGRYRHLTWVCKLRFCKNFYI